MQSGLSRVFISCIGGVRWSCILRLESVGGGWWCWWLFCFGVVVCLLMELQILLTSVDTAEVVRLCDGGSSKQVVIR